MMINKALYFYSHPKTESSIANNPNSCMYETNDKTINQSVAALAESGGSSGEMGDKSKELQSTIDYATAAATEEGFDNRSSNNSGRYIKDYYIQI